MNIEAVKAQCLRLEEWLRENAPEVFADHRQLDEGSEARKYWHYGRYVALRDLLRTVEH